MSALVGKKGSKSGMVGDGGRTVMEHVLATRDNTDATTSYTLGFAPKMLYCAGQHGTSSSSGHGIGHGAASETASTALRQQVTYGVGGNSMGSNEGGRWEGPYTTSGNSTPVTEGMLYRMTAGSQYLWQARVNSMDSNGFTLWFDAAYNNSGSGCHLRIIGLR